MESLPLPPLQQAFRSYSRAAGYTALGLVALVLLATGLSAGALRFVWPAGPTSEELLALALAALSLALAQGGKGSWRSRASWLSAALLVLICLAALISGFLARSGIGFSPAAAAVLLFIGLALLLLDRVAPRGRVPAELPALAAGFIVFLGLLGHLYSVRGLYKIPAYPPLDSFLLAAMLLLVTGILAARPERGMAALVSGAGAGGYMARRLLPAALILPPVLGWLRLLGEQAGYYGLDYGLALFATANVVTFASLVLWNAHSLSELDARRRQAEQDLQQAKDDLEMRVHQRTAELTQANDELHREVAERERTEQKFRGFLESAPDAIIVTDADGRILLVNAQAELWFGYGREELVGRFVEVLVPPAARGGHADLRRQYAAHPHARPMGMGMALHAQRKDGSRFPVEVSLSPLHTAEGLRITAIVRDISERLRAEGARQEMQERYRQLVDNLPIGVFRNRPEPDGRFAEANPALAAMFDAASVEELLACPVRRLYRDPAQRRRFSDKLLGEGAVLREELELVSLQGREFIGAVTAVLKQDAGGERYFDGIIEDVTQLKAAEHAIHDLNDALVQRNAELETVNQELESFSYSVSHDLRAPLRAIDGFSQAVLEDYADKLDAAGRDALQRLRAAAQRMGMLIDDLLKLARVTRAELASDEVDLSALAKEVVDELRQREPQRVVEVSIHADMSARGDGRLLRVALENLLSNAWKFSAGSHPARIEVGMSEEAGERVYFVRDNGVGFDMAYAGKLFGAFQRLHDAHEFPGTGVGLATVQRIMRKHGGRIWAQSEVGHGTVFNFTL